MLAHRNMSVVDPLAAMSNEETPKICNPPFIHALAVPEGQLLGDVGRTMVAARGDGAVDVFDLQFKGDEMSDCRGKKKKSGEKLGRGTSESFKEEGSFVYDLPGRLCHLSSDMQGHTSAVSTV